MYSSHLNAPKDSTHFSTCHSLSCCSPKDWRGVSTCGWRTGTGIVIPFDAPDRTNGDVLIPQLPSRKVHDILLADAADHPLDLLGIHPSSTRHDLSAYVFSDSSGAIKAEQDGGFELSFGSLDLGFGDVVR